MVIEKVSPETHPNISGEPRPVGKVTDVTERIFPASSVPTKRPPSPSPRATASHRHRKNLTAAEPGLAVRLAWTRHKNLVCRPTAPHSGASPRPANADRGEPRRRRNPPSSPPSILVKEAVTTPTDGVAVTRRRRAPPRATVSSVTPPVQTAAQPERRENFVPSRDGSAPAVAVTPNSVERTCEFPPRRRHSAQSGASIQARLARLPGVRPPRHMFTGGGCRRRRRQGGCATCDGGLGRGVGEGWRRRLCGEAACVRDIKPEEGGVGKCGI